MLQGGLGNQMFQIAAAASLAKDLNTVSVFSDNNLSNLQPTRASTYKNNIFSRINLIENNEAFKNLSFYNEMNFSYSEIPKKDNLILNGYFQSEKYFIHNSEYIRNIYSETEEITKYIDEKYWHINFSNAVSLHVRRGDYIKFPNIHPVCQIEYYNNSINELDHCEKILIFSDDIQWCKNNIKYKNCYFIEQEPDYIDLYLISRCRDNIIANSSFSWWGAWLNKNSNKKVILPLKWFGPSGPKDTHDISPVGWIRK